VATSDGTDGRRSDGKDWLERRRNLSEETFYEMMEDGDRPGTRGWLARAADALRALRPRL
jgi:hypothetical protein